MFVSKAQSAKKRPLITSKTLIAGLVILVVVIILAIAILYFLARSAGNYAAHYTTSVQGYNTSARNSTGYNTTGYNASGYNDSTPPVKKGGPVT